MITIVIEYNKYVRSLPQLINNTYYKAEYFVKALGISQPTYYRKLRDNAFTVGEITILTKLLFPKEAYLQEIKADLLQGEQDIKDGNVISHDKLMKQLDKQYL